MEIKCIKKCLGCTPGRIYTVIRYEPDLFYIILDDDNQEHYISIAFGVDNFQEV